MAIVIEAAVETAMINAAANAWADSIDATSAGAYWLYLANGTTEVATCRGPATFFGAAVAGVCTQASAATDTDATGNVAAVTVFIARNGADGEVWRGSVGESGQDLNISDGTVDTNVIIDTNAVVTLTGITLTVTLA